MPALRDLLMKALVGLFTSLPVRIPLLLIFVFDLQVFLCNRLIICVPIGLRFHLFLPLKASRFSMSIACCSFALEQVLK